MKFTGVISTEISKYWGRIEGFIASGLAEGESLDHILERLISRSCQLWIVCENEKVIAACITEIPTLAGRKVFNVISIGGSGMNEWLHNLATLEAYARHHGCTAMRFPEVRPGWRRILKDYHVTKINLEKELTHGKFN